MLAAGNYCIFEEREKGTSRGPPASPSAPLRAAPSVTDTLSGTIFHCADAYVTVVAVDETHAMPVQLPFELDPQEPADKLRYKGAVSRRSEQLALRGSFTAGETSPVSLDGGHTYSPPPELADDGAANVLEAIPPL